MPHDAPAIKAENTRRYGAEIVGYDRESESREDIARALVAERNAVLVPSFDDWDIMAGQGTCGLELATQAAELDVALDVVLTCCGGGGLTAGIATAFEGLSPETAAYSVEPAAFDDHARSLAAGHRLSIDPSGKSFCDALLAPMPGELTFSINRHLLRGGLVVSDEEVEAAMRYAFRELKLVVEPGGAVALAAVLAGKLDFAGKNVGVIVSGGNVDPELFAQVLRRGSDEGPASR